MPFSYCALRGLKHKLRNWLIQKDEVIAYAQAKPEDGGSGAVIVLLKA